MWAFHFVFNAGSKSRPEFRQRRQVQVETPVTYGGPRTWWWRHRGAARSAAFVVAALVATQGLSGGETPVAYRALVGPTAATGRRRRAGGDGGGVVVSGVELAVAGLVAA